MFSTYVLARKVLLMLQWHGLSFCFVPLKCWCLKQLPFTLFTSSLYNQVEHVARRVEGLTKHHLLMLIYSTLLWRHKSLELVICYLLPTIYIVLYRATTDDNLHYRWIYWLFPGLIDQFNLWKIVKKCFEVQSEVFRCFDLSDQKSKTPFRYSVYYHI